MFHSYSRKKYIYMNIVLRKNDFLVKTENVTKRPTYTWIISIIALLKQSTTQYVFPFFSYQFILPRSIISLTEFFLIPRFSSVPSSFSYRISPSIFTPLQQYFTVPNIPSKDFFNSSLNVFFSGIFPIHNYFSNIRHIFRMDISPLRHFLFLKYVSYFPVWNLSSQ